MMAINAALPDTVSIGNVYVPKALRGEGRAGQIVSLWLHRLTANGVRRAVLFAATPTAQRSYEKIGFAKIDTFRVIILKAPMQIGQQP